MKIIKYLLIILFTSNINVYADINIEFENWKKSFKKIALKNNISQLWWKSMTQLHENIVGLDSAILMDPKIWEASGHVGAFNDPLVDCKQCKARYRADALGDIENEKI